MKLVAISIVVALGAAACGTTTVVKKKSANADCQKDPTKCPSDPGPTGEGDTSDTEEDPIQAVPDPGSASTSSATDAGSPDAQKKDAATTGSECAQLDACCTQLGDAGYDTTTCKGYVSSHDETTCKTQHASYKSFGDCT